ncbi:alpha/beta fold hydrolase [Promicromonospora thailandica]|uniref:Pimeloyl-ACP methyl ester carboxylesterase n=1 Tax=Promicromonospora thailandica TaxID=765201 RepID=A0A9X2G2U1_9MICO|nr:alpha/beta fold hydrolase [Promicromonospora thailandica]MCP2266050.1 Pimeloyl-ACP methyl ester carboxylesterase [Promicromonospora thailandica]
MERTIQKLVPVEGSSVSIDVYGEPDAPALVVIPGAMADAAEWGGVARDLRGWPTVVVVNRRGRQPSGPLTDQYSLGAEIEDAATVLRGFSDVRTLFGWSYGGLIALQLAATLRVPHLIAYEPVMAPFGAPALPDLRRAQDAGDAEAIVETVLGRVTGMGADRIESLRSQDEVWAQLLRLSAPAYAETHAINEAGRPESFAGAAERVDLVVGERNRGQAPYGTTFDDVARRVPGARVHVLPGQGHLAHLEAPERLAALLDELGSGGSGGRPVRDAA